MARFLSCVLVALALAAGPWRAMAAAPDRIALVIGNGAYKHTSPLRNPPNDARLMAATLRSLRFHVIERIDASQRAMKLAIAEFADRIEKAGGDGVGVVFYAGHGVQVQGQNYLIPVDARIERESHVDAFAVTAESILRTMDFADNRLNFVILDACRNNPYARSFRSASRGLARMDAPRGTLIAYATRPGDVAADGKGANSPYTEALARTLVTPDLTVSDVFIRVRNQVMAATDQQQVPWEEGGLTSRFYFAGQGTGASAAAPASAPVVPPVNAEVAFWQSIEDSTNPAMFEEYLRQFPNGRFKGLAAIKLKEFKEREVAAARPPARPAPAEPPGSRPAVGVYPSKPARRPPPKAFRDCEQCPEMVVVPAGAFRMGDIQGTGYPQERPVHTVTIAKPFAIGKYEVTYDEFDRFSEETGHYQGAQPVEGDAAPDAAAGGGRLSDPGWGRGRRPAVQVPFADAVAYTRWLSKKTGKRYRLPTEAEWEYAARGGTETVFWWGDAESRDRANYGAGVGGWFPKPVVSGKDRWTFTAPVGSFPANPFGLHDTAGNAWEHVQDCWQDSYAGAPADGTAVGGERCANRVMRGGSWGYEAGFMRSSSRIRVFWAVTSFLYYGFRVVREME